MRKRRGLISAGALVAAALIAGSAGFRGAEPTDSAAVDAERLAAGAFCACGCGNHLSDGPHGPGCFGCSVAKADLAFIRERLAAGSPIKEILLELNDSILLEVFADYDDDRLLAIWELAQRVARELHHHRLVLRTQARSAAARRAVELAECARLNGSFASMQHALIRHSGPWDENTLLRLADREGLSPAFTRSCLASVNVQSQIDKDRQHAGQRNVGDRPAVFVNRKRVDAFDAALRRAIVTADRENSI